MQARSHVVVDHQYVSSRVLRRLAHSLIDRSLWILETNVDVISARAVTCDMLPSFKRRSRKKCLLKLLNDTVTPCNNYFIVDYLP